MRRHSLYLVLGIALLRPALAQQNTPSPAAPASTGGTLEGRVENAKTGEPVRRVNLTLRPSGQMGGAVVGPMAPTAPYVASTDAEGKFRMEKVEPGNYMLMAERQGFVRQTYGARSSGMMNFMGTTIKIAVGQELKGLNLKMTPQAVLTGRVLDEEGEPLARAQVQVLRKRYFQGKSQLMPLNMAQSLDTGEFRLADIAPGRYWLMVNYRGQMMFGEGPARNTGGQPEEQYVATFYPGTTEETGAQPIEVEAGQQLTGLDVRMRKARVYRVSGRVTGGGTQSIRVFTMAKGGFGFMGMGGSSSAVKPDGTFEMGGLVPGSYRVVAATAQGMMTTLGQTTVDVGQENVEGVVVPVAGISTMRGVVRADGDLAPLEKAQGKKITFESVRIQLVALDGAALNTPNTQVKADGSFAMENIGAQRYRVSTYNVPNGLWVKAVRAGDQDVTENGVDLTGGSAAVVEVVLGIGVGQITGVVQDSRQKPAAGSIVSLVPEPLPKHQTDRMRMVTTDQNGQFTLQGVAPGDYKLYAWEDVEPGAYSDADFLKPHEGSAKKVTVKVDGAEQVSLVQVPAEATVIR